MDSNSFNLSDIETPFKSLKDGHINMCNFDIPVVSGDEKDFVEHLRDRYNNDMIDEIIDEIFRIGCLYLYNEWKKNKKHSLKI